ncbi:unnamed protein product [Pedinophyceae sp. YPF-701]|nr:unnamed protein product [Pedinophyceae sp. YPF-701]
MFATSRTGKLRIDASSAAPQGELAFELPPARTGLGATPFASISSRSFPEWKDQADVHPRAPQLVFTTARAATSERFRVIKIIGDGRCMFRAMAHGLAHNKGIALNPKDEEREADELRMACAEALCTSQKRRAQFRDAMEAVRAEGEELPSYCRKMTSPTFWGGEPELITLSKMLRVPIYVYLSESEMGADSTGFVPVQKYGEQFAKAAKDGSRKARRPVRLVFTGGNHYDLLLK